jgi:hypothetical protein
MAHKPNLKPRATGTGAALQATLTASGVWEETR